MRERVLVVGPCPPPAHGTSIPFQLLVDFLAVHSDADLRVVNTESGDKSGLTLLSWGIIRSFLSVFFRFCARVVPCRRVVVYGSQRFIATSGCILTFTAATILRKQTSVYIQGGSFDQYLRSLNPIARFFVRFCLGRARSICVQTRLVRDALAHELGNAVLVPNWVGNTTGEVQSAKCGEMEMNEVRFVFVGDVKREKGIVELVEAFCIAARILQLAGRSISLDVYGSATDSVLREVLPLVRSCGVPFSYHGVIGHNQLLNRLGTYDVLALPSKWPSEGYPAVVLEAMSRGLPAIVSRFRALPEIVTDGVNGLLCEPSDTESLAECIISIATEDALRRRMGARAQVMAGRFSIQVVGPALCRAFGVPIRGLERLPLWQNRPQHSRASVLRPAPGSPPGLSGEVGEICG